MKIPTMSELKQVSNLKILRVKSIAFVIAQIFPKHIGENNGISKSKLFKQIFGQEDEGTLADELRWDYTKRAMHFLRQRTKCFISSKYDKITNEWYYFVIKNLSDAQCYIDTLNKNIKRMRIMQKRAMTAVEQGWYRENWMTFAEHNPYWKDTVMKSKR